jgi:imidazolonepropionase-like amidohydrolase
MFAAVAASIAFASSSWAAESVTLIHAGELLAVPGQAPGRNKTIIIEDGQIADVRNGFVEAESIDGGAAVIDLRDKFVLPGLMDMHVHLQFELGPENDRDALKMSDQLMQMRSVYYAMKTLEAGFTTVRCRCAAFTTQ